MDDERAIRADARARGDDVTAESSRWLAEQPEQDDGRCRCVARLSGYGAGPPVSDPLDDARALLQHAGRAGTAAERYILAHRAAVSTAAALVAVILPDRPPRSQPFGVWVMLANAARELGEDEGVYRREAAYFAQISQVTAAVRAGVTWLVADDEADELLRRARYFLGCVSYTIQQRRAASG